MSHAGPTTGTWRSCLSPSARSNRSLPRLVRCGTSGLEVTCSRTSRSRRCDRSSRRGIGERSFVLPTLENLPLWRLTAPGSSPVGDRPVDESLLLPCIPNTFIAVVDREVADARARECEAACRALWRGIAEDVRHQLDDRIRSCEDLAAYCDGWDRLWSEQLDSFFEIRTAILPWAWWTERSSNGGCPVPKSALMRKAACGTGGSSSSFDSCKRHARYATFRLTFQTGQSLRSAVSWAAMSRWGRPTWQMADSRAFWQLMSQSCRHGGTRTSPGERLLAPSVWSSDTPGR